MKDGIALDFLLEVFGTWKQEKDLTSLKNALRKANIDNKLVFHLLENVRG